MTPQQAADRWSEALAGGDTLRTVLRIYGEPTLVGLRLATKQARMDRLRHLRSIGVEEPPEPESLDIGDDSIIPWSERVSLGFDENGEPSA